MTVAKFNYKIVDVRSVTETVHKILREFREVFSEANLCTYGQKIPLIQTIITVRLYSLSSLDNGPNLTNYLFNGSSLITNYWYMTREGKALVIVFSQRVLRNTD